MSTIETVWWLLFFATFGLCVGSFLNVAIYRIPMGLQLGRPVRSFCPHCHADIAWYDNLPLISYLWLGARARCCGRAISIRYPLIEAATAVVVVLLLDAFFIGQVRTGLDDTAIGLSWRLAEGWPIYLAHVILFACLLAMSAIDIEHYWIDTAFSTAAILAGCVLHALWTPADSFARLSGSGVHEGGWIRPWECTAAVSLAAFVGVLITKTVSWLWRPSDETDPADPGESPPSLDSPTEQPEALALAAPADLELRIPPENEPQTEPPPAADELSIAPPAASDKVAPHEEGTVRRQLAAWVLAAGLAGLIGAGAWANVSPDPAAYSSIRYGVPIAAFFIWILAVGSTVRETDAEIAEAIESERSGARRMALLELARLLPAIVLAVAAFLGYQYWQPAREWIHGTLCWRPMASGEWQPVFGLATAAGGLVVAGGLGWAVRILATLLLGKEAFGDGDIHIMAAAGCVAGWSVVALGFVFACVIALLGWLILLLFKRTRVIWFVPWLSLAFLGTVVFYEPIVASRPVQNLIELVEWLVLGADS